MLITSIVGARPQFIKAAMVSSVLKKKKIPERMIHTGQHYNFKMSKIFFEELGLPEPAVNLNVGSGSHGTQTAEALRKIESELLSHPPDAVIVYGDTNSTLAGALAAAKLNIPIFHVEAGLRSCNQAMPEEINRIAADRLSSLLFVPTQTALFNLKKEGITKNVHLTGDVMYDSLLHFSRIAEKRSYIMKKLRLNPKDYQLLTLHRPSNVDNPHQLKKILGLIQDTANIKTIFPVHPRTEKILKPIKKQFKSTICFIPPVGYFDMLMLQKHAFRILTDSGGIQKEAYLQKVPCITIRTETEWIETTKNGWNRIVGKKIENLKTLLKAEKRPGAWKAFYGSGKASFKIADIIFKWLRKNKTRYTKSS
ncbi:MAG: UDP-N-acetylglucosamine 2-epimerase [Omnitrophica bacterium RIFCSPLOWO2_12_FULL_44_17]|uniref:UDP-N-acetylglucosamine 2-epimerase n=1 Tax=Candidatus Danuiimicrobium aquiferis TaxID=1801832 RepID=A0A1G1KX84_9BACT|nr:MAG: UDP-N-acetylglucosamine 2-epimerase [Omnitrophica bacterium RIFCSPHIGHO2_02_FULL_45_28]OGW89617.1 MAG: UDP-N-acetylglucosamine 2-epimerase [Omnitrophica bacterium RIFCSPHIGHO2_12_FULL_44_12]OGW97422.1 MAG: UDP-N-acetylglucosamine 2-epimerase [Omnitrophica bacterium RIFCSPLOWO2_12_FULL_44_17]OGX04496.1 MAG: UDP-N-acetylglucosamine 2-epimerase [Omnitrophica bacterium RIFCSPLOWO2_02_FULL_44_11]